MIKKIVFEPLVHFLLLGLLLYVYYNSTQTEKITLKTPIHISSYEVQQLKLEYKKELSHSFLQALIKKRYYEKVLLDKAYSIKLAQNDTIIKKRLLQQMEFVMTDKSASQEPSEKELREYYKKNIQDYSSIKTLSFASIYLANPSNETLKTMYKLLSISQPNAKEALYFGDKSSLGNFAKNITQEKAQELYGRYFTAKLFTLKQHLWHKAIRTKKGVRFVYITKKDVENSEDFDMIQGRVYNDFLQERLSTIKKKAFEKIAASYTLQSDYIEKP